MSHELLTIAHVHAYRDEMLSDSGTGGRGECPDEDRGPSRLRVRAGLISIRLGSWLLRRQVDGFEPGPLTNPDLIQPGERQSASAS